jgi:hypothetical protein
MVPAGLGYHAGQALRLRDLDANWRPLLIVWGSITDRA